MTDEELIERLRDLGMHSPSVAADRIESLVRERDEALNQLDSVRHSVDVLEGRVAMFMARLAKAMEALRRMADGSSDNSEAEARAVLAEIGGGQ